MEKFRYIMRDSVVRSA